MLFAEAEKTLAEMFSPNTYWSIQYRSNTHGCDKPCYIYIESPPEQFIGATFEDCFRKLEAFLESQKDTELKSGPEILNGIEDVKEKENDISQ